MAVMTKEEIKAARKSCVMTQAAFADALGVARNTVIRWEKGTNKPEPYIKPAIQWILYSHAIEVAKAN